MFSASGCAGRRALSLLGVGGAQFIRNNYRDTGTRERVFGPRGVPGSISRRARADVSTLINRAAFVVMSEVAALISLRSK